MLLWIIYQFLIRNKTKQIETSLSVRFKPLFNLSIVHPKFIFESDCILTLKQSN